jgi:uncharacterized protein YjbI with pentapeptide repeats
LAWLAGADFDGADLSRADLTGANLGGSSFRDANLRGTKFEKTNLDQADLSGADVAGAHFEAQNVPIPLVQKTKNWLLTSWSDDTIRGLGAAPNHNERVARKDFSGYVLDHANLSGHDLSNASFRGAKMLEASLDNANLAGADLTDTYLRGASLRGACVTGDQIRSARDWLFAFYGEGRLRRELNLPEDHDQRGPKKDFTKYILRRLPLRKHYFYDCNLSGAVLDGCDARDVSFGNATLKATSLREADLRGSSFVAADLEDADLQGTNLSRCAFENASVARANFREALLVNAQLQRSLGLTARQLLGSNLTGATLPEGVKEFKALEIVEEATKTSRKLLVTMLAACLYCLLAIATTKDASLFLGSTSIPLPFVQMPMSSLWFYVLAPALLLVVYLYFHLSIQALWEAFASLPAVFTNGRPLHERAHPWVLNTLVRRHFKLLRGECGLVTWLQILMSYVIAWWAVPVTITVFWLRFLVKRDWLITGSHIAILCLSGMAALLMMMGTQVTLSGNRVVKAQWYRSLFQWSIWTRIVASLLIAAVLSWTTHNAFSRQWIGRLATANLSDANLSVKPAQWTDRTREALKQVEGAVFAPSDLRFALFNRAFAVNVTFDNVSLVGADFTGADLRGARFFNAHLERANFTYADLRDATFYGGYLDDANFSKANVQGTGFYNLIPTIDQLARADNWILAKLEDWSSLGLSGDQKRRLLASDFRGCDFSQFRDSLSLRYAELGGFDLSKSVLRGVNVTRANLQGADLSGARLSQADFSDAILDDADLRGADLSQTKGLTRIQISKAHMDAKTLLPGYLPR